MQQSQKRGSLMRVEGITSINRRLRKFGQKLNTASYLREPRIDVLNISLDNPIPAHLGVHIKENGILEFGIEFLNPPRKDINFQFLSSVRSFVDEASMDMWWRNILEIRDVVQALNEEQHRIL